MHFRLCEGIQSVFYILNYCYTTTSVCAWCACLFGLTLFMCIAPCLCTILFWDVRMYRLSGTPIQKTFEFAHSTMCAKSHCSRSLLIFCALIWSCFGLSSHRVIEIFFSSSSTQTLIIAWREQKGSVLNEKQQGECWGFREGDWTSGNWRDCYGMRRLRGTERFVVPYWRQLLPSIAT